MAQHISFASGTEDGKPWVMCPLCFGCNFVESARAGGMLSTTEDGMMSDVCVDCNAKEWLYFANLMGA